VSKTTQLGLFPTQLATAEGEASDWQAASRAQFPPTDWRSAWGHTCEACGYDCGSPRCHGECCGTSHGGPPGSNCTGHPCPDCRARAHDISGRYGEADRLAREAACAAAGHGEIKTSGRLAWCTTCHCNVPEVITSA